MKNSSRFAALALLFFFLVSALGQPCVAPAPRVIGWWTGDHDATDHFGVHPGAFVNGATNGPGFVGQAFQLDGINDRVDLGAWSPGTQWTLETWVKPSSLPAGRRAIAGGVNQCRDWGLVLENGRYGVSIRPPSGCSQTLAAGATTSTNAWTHLAATCDGTNAALYINGALATSGPVALNYSGTTVGAMIGASSCCGEYFPGSIDEVTIYDASLSASQVAAIYAAGAAGKCRDVTAPYIFSNPTAPPFVRQGSNVTMAVAATGSPLLSYRWQFDGSDLPGANSNVLALTNLALNQSGIYRAVVTNNAGAATSAPVTITVSPVDLFAISLGTTVSNGVPGPGAGRIETNLSLDVFTLSASSNDTVFIRDDGASGLLDLLWYDPLGNYVFGERLNGNHDLNRRTLLRTGTYTLHVLSCCGVPDHTGTYGFALLGLPPDAVYPITVGDLVTNDVPAAGAGRLDLMGEQDLFTFSAVSNNTIYLEDLDAETPIDLALYAPNGVLVAAERLNGSSDINRRTLTQTGTYTIYVYGAGDRRSTGRYAFRLRSVPPDDTFAITIPTLVTNDLPGPGAGHLDLPGQWDLFTFSAVSNTSIYLQDLDADNAIDLSLHDPAGARLFAERLNGNSDINRRRLTSTGTYTIYVYGAGDGRYTGHYAFALRDAPTDSFALPLNTVVSNGVPGAGAGHLDVPGEWDVFTFNVISNETYFFEDLDGDAGIDWQLQNDLGQRIFSDRFDGSDPGARRVTRTGTYSLYVYGTGDGRYTGNYRFRVHTVPAAQTYALTIGQLVTNDVPAAGAGRLDVPGEEDLFTVSVSPGTSVFFQDRGGANYMDWELRDDQGAQIFRDRLDGSSVGNRTLTRGGTYTLHVYALGQAEYVGNYSFRLLLPAPVITQQPQSQIAALGRSASFTVGAYSDTPISYRWFRSGAALPHGTNATLFITNVQAADAAGYYVVLTNETGFSQSQTVYLYVPAVIPVSEGGTTNLPFVAGNGVHIDLFNGIGGGAPPTLNLLTNLTPSGETLSPVVDFPHPGTVISVGNSFNTFFADTTTPPEVVSGLSARNFILRINAFLRVEQGFDLNPGSPEIDVYLGVGSDDGFRLSVGTNYLGQIGDRSFNFTWMPASFEQPGLYPVELLFAANAVGQSGLEFSWNHAGTGGTNQLIPQSALYLNPNVGDRLITFEEVPPGTVLSNQFAGQGVLFRTVSGQLEVTTNFPAQFVPVSPVRVLGDPRSNPPELGEVELSFVVPGTQQPAPTTFASFFVIDAETTGANVTVFDPTGTMIFSNQYHGGGGAQEQVIISHPRIARIRVTLGAGADTVALDNLTFSSPISRPDLAVGNLIAPANVQPGQPATVTWAVTNLGSESVTSAWSEVVALSSDAVVGGDTILGVFTVTVPLAPGAFLLRTQSVVIPFSGPAGATRFVVTVDSGHQIVEQSDDNNSALAVDTSVIPLTLQLAIPNPQIAENASPGTLTAQVGRNGSTSNALTVALLSSDTTEAVVESNAIIPAGQNSAPFALSVVADGIADPDVVVTIGATAAGFTGASSNIVVLNTDLPALSLSISNVNLVEGESRLVGVTRSHVNANSLTVTLSSSSPGQLSVPASATIPANQASGSFTLAAVDDANLESAKTYTLGAAAPGHSSAAALVTVLDDDRPEVSLALSRSSVSEGDGPTAASGVLSRPTPGVIPLTVALTSSDPSEALVPPTVTFPPGATSVVFAISAVEDAVLDGAQIITITGTLLETVGGQPVPPALTTNFTVLDNDGPALSVQIARDLVGEGLSNATTAIIRRNLTTNSPLVVSLTSSDTTEATVPPTATVPASQTETTIVINSIADGITDGSQTVTLTASAAGYTSGSDTLVVSDADVPDLVITSISTVSNGLTETYFSLTYRESNLGLAAATGSWSQMVFLSRDRVLDPSDLLLGEFPFAGSIPPGLFFERTLQFRLPREPGTYWPMVRSDPHADVTEALEDNNLTIASTPINVAAAYSATVQTDFIQGLAGTPVVMTGTATRTGGGPAAFEIVNIFIKVRETVRVLSALTDQNGNFAGTFRPLLNEAGHYTIGAAHPGLSDAPVQDAFDLLGMKFDPATVTQVLAAQTSLSNTVVLTNRSELPLTGLTASILNAPADVTVNVSNPAVLPGSAAVPVTYQIVSSANASFAGIVTIRLTSAEGARADLPIDLRVETLQPRLVAHPASLTAGMLRGGQTIVSFTVINQGGAASAPLNVLLPPTDFLHLSSPSPLPSLAPGGSNRVTLLLTPATNTPLTEFRGSIVVSGAGASVSVPFAFRALSDAVGSLLVEAVDEYTYYAEGSPRVTNATIVVKDALAGTVVTNGVTGPNGQVFFANLPESYYTLEATAPQHNQARSTVFIAAGQTNQARPFLSRQAVQYIWNVVPTEIEDRTRVTIETIFETVVPIPVVTVHPNVIDLADIQQEVSQIDLVITNHGLIAALNVRIDFGSHPDWQFTPLVTELGTLPARSSVTVPLTIRRLHRVGFAALAPANYAGGCGAAAQILWELICETTKTYGAPIAIINAGGGCGGGGGGVIVPCCGGGGLTIYPVSFSNTGLNLCDPCGADIAGALLDCVIGFLPIPDVVNCAKGTYECITEPSVLGCAGAALDCLAAAGKEVPVVGQVISALQCIDGLMSACGGPGLWGWLSGGGGGLAFSGLIPGSGFVQAAAVGWAGAQAALQSPPYNVLNYPGMAEVAERARRLNTYREFYRSLLGDDAWIHPGQGTNFGVWLEAFGAAAKAPTDGGLRISASESNALLSVPFPDGLAVSNINKFIARWNRTVDYDSAGIRDSNQVPVGQSTDFIARNVFSNAVAQMRQAIALDEAEGYSDAMAGLKAKVDLLRERLIASANSGGVCARVRLRLDQDVIVTRDAFHATLEIINNSASSLDNVSVELMVKTESGELATSRFALRPPEVTGISDVAGNGSVGAGATARASWILIPTSEAAPMIQLPYFVSGSLRYVQDGVLVTVPLAPVRITVFPNPSLALKYFHERDVRSDDPFTPQIEPSIPYSLAVMVINNGPGTARRVRITSGEPQIVENEKGLLIDFDILGTEVAGQSLTPSLTADFGELLPGAIGLGRWLFKSTLQGQFVSYSATFEHLDGLGDPRLSLIDSVEIHELIHIVRAPGIFEDNLPDFLVNDFNDFDALPDTLYLSNGSNAPVAAITSASISGTVSGTNLTVTLTASVPSDWVYLRTTDPGQGRYRMIRVRRSDSTELRLGDNVWTTDRTFIGGGARPVYENKLHLFDLNSTGSYTLEYAPLAATDTIPPVSAVTPLPPNSFAQVPLSWSGQDEPGGSGIAFYDLYVSTDGGAFTRYLERTTGSGLLFLGEHGHAYSFYVVATDNAGNREPIPATPDATTTITLVNSAPVLMAGTNQTVSEGSLVTILNSATDPDLPGQTLTFSLGTGSPLGATINSGSGRVTWPTGEGTGPSTNVVTIMVRDSGVPSLSATGRVTVVVNEVNAAPSLAPFAVQTVSERRLLQVQAQATDPDLPANTLTFSLGAGAPAGATIDSLTGLFRWTPNDIQGGTTNSIVVIVHDNGVPSLTATQVLNVIVRDTSADFRISIGSTNVQPGQSSFVPTLLSSGIELTNVSFLLEADLSRLSGLALSPIAPEVLSATLSPAGTNRAQINFGAANGQFFIGTLKLATLDFDVSSNRHSAVVPLTPSQVLGTRSDTGALVNGAGFGGQVVMVGDEPVLMWRGSGTNGPGTLVLFGTLGSSWQLQGISALGAGLSWQHLGTITFSNLTSLPWTVPLTNPAQFFRLRSP